MIPARLHSTRLSHKVILNETGKFLVQHVYERAKQVEGADEVLVETQCVLQTVLHGLSDLISIISTRRLAEQ